MTAPLAREEERVEAKSAALKKKRLGLRDLVLQQIVYVVGTVWVGTAAKLGHSQLIFWLAAMLFFYLPQAAVVIDLSRRMPLEGGLYQWARLGLGELMGFMVAWNLWIYAVVLIATIGLVIGTNISYVVGPHGAWMASNKTFIMVLNAFLLAGLAVLAAVGLGVSKWLHNAGSVMLMLAFVALIGLPFVHMARGTLPAYHPFAVAMPALTLFSLNVFGKMSMGALSGFEYVAVLAGETKNPERSIGKATLIAAPIIAVMFILGTSAVLAFVPVSQINLIGPIPQVLKIGFGASGLGAVAAGLAILLLTGRTLANSSIVFTATTRMPMVAGWDNLLPKWFTRLHPRYRTPVNSILFVGLVALAFGAAGIAGVGEQEAFQLLDNAAGIFYGLTYLVMFAIPLIGFRHANPKPALWLRVAAASGFAVTALYVVLSIFPIIDVKSWMSFAMKISSVVILLNLAGAALFVGARRRRTARRAAEAVVAAVALCALGGRARAQQPVAVDTARCDSIIAASKTDSVLTGVFVAAVRRDGIDALPGQLEAVAMNVGAGFVSPHPLQLTVFAGQATFRALRHVGQDTTSQLRAPVVSGLYRMAVARRGSPSSVGVLRASLIPGFDSAAIVAMRVAANIQAAALPTDSPAPVFGVRFSTDSTLGALRLSSAWLPRMPVVDAVARADNPAPPFPDSAMADSEPSGDIVLRFVVDRDGKPLPETVELVRGQSADFLKAAIEAVPSQRFSPATIHGCAVAQVVDYVFTFVRPNDATRH